MHEHFTVHSPLIASHCTVNIIQTCAMHGLAPSPSQTLSQAILLLANMLQPQQSPLSSSHMLDLCVFYLLWAVCPPNHRTYTYTEALTPSLAILEGRASKQITKVK